MRGLLVGTFAVAAFTLAGSVRAQTNASIPTATYTKSHEGRIEAVTTAEGTTRYSYFDDGLIREVVYPNGSRDTFAHDEIVAAAKLVDRLTREDQQVMGGSPVAPISNLQGDDPFQVSGNRFAFTGYYFDLETGLYFAKARYYDPAVGRFVTQDSHLGQIDNPPSLHRYFYAASNPTHYVDPTGHAFTEAEKRQFFMQTGRNVGWLNEKANSAAPLATAVTVTVLTAGVAAPLVAPVVVAGPTLVAGVPAGAVLTSTIAGAAGGASGAFVAAKGQGASTEQAVDSATVGGLSGSIGGAIGAFTGIVTETAFAAKTAGGAALARLTGAFVGGATADAAAQATLVASGNKQNVDLEESVRSGAIAAAASAATSALEPPSPARPLEGRNGLRQVAVETHAIAGAKNVRGMRQSAVAVVEVTLADGTTTYYAAGSGGRLTPAQRETLVGAGVPEENILWGAEYTKGFTREQNHAEQIINRNLPAGAKVEGWGISWAGKQKPIPCVGCEEMVAATGAPVQGKQR